MLVLVFLFLKYTARGIETAKKGLPKEFGTRRRRYRWRTDRFGAIRRCAEDPLGIVHVDDHLVSKAQVTQWAAGKRLNL